MTTRLKEISVVCLTAVEISLIVAGKPDGAIVAGIATIIGGIAGFTVTAVKDGIAKVQEALS